jgi:hypothetical protein
MLKGCRFTYQLTITQKKMTTLTQLEKQLQDLRIAFAQKLLTTNEYCETYLAISKKIKAIK